MKTLLKRFLVLSLFGMAACLPQEEQKEEDPGSRNTNTPVTYPTVVYQQQPVVPAAPVPTAGTGITANWCDINQGAAACPLADPRIQAMIKVCKDNGGGSACESKDRVEQFQKQLTATSTGLCSTSSMYSRGTDLRIRSTPDVNSTTNILGYMDFGEEIVVASREGDWVKGKAKGFDNAYVARDFLQCTKPTSAASTSSGTTGTATGTTGTTATRYPCEYFKRSDGDLSFYGGPLTDCTSHSGKIHQESGQEQRGCYRVLSACICQLWGKYREKLTESECKTLNGTLIR